MAPQSVTPEWWWSPALSAAVSMTIAVVGWGIVHRLGIRAQRAQFRRQLLNTCRLDVVASLTDASNALRRVLLATVRAEAAVRYSAESGSSEASSAISDLLTALAAWQPTEEWARLMDEYEVFFPGSADLRNALRQRYRDSVAQLRGLERALHHKLAVISASAPRDAQEYAKAIRPAFTHGIVSLVVPSSTYTQLEALRVFVQHEGLREITGDDRGAKVSDPVPAAQVFRSAGGKLEFGTRLEPEFALPPQDRR